MANSIPETIALEVVARLEAITIANGYTFDNAGVTRVNRNANDWRPRNYSIAVEQGSDSENDEQTHGGNPAAIAYDLTFEIHGFIRESDTSTTASDATENAMVAAIKLALAGETNWHNWDGNATNTHWGSTQPFVSREGDHSGVTVPLTVTYRISENDPFTARA